MEKGERRENASLTTTETSPRHQENSPDLSAGFLAEYCKEREPRRSRPAARELNTVCQSSALADRASGSASPSADIGSERASHDRKVLLLANHENTCACNPRGETSATGRPHEETTQPCKFLFSRGCAPQGARKTSENNGDACLRRVSRAPTTGRQTFRRRDVDPDVKQHLFAVLVHATSPSVLAANVPSYRTITCVDAVPDGTSARRGTKPVPALGERKSDEPQKGEVSPGDSPKNAAKAMEERLQRLENAVTAIEERLRPENAVKAMEERLQRLESMIREVHKAFASSLTKLFALEDRSESFATVETVRSVSKDIARCARKCEDLAARILFFEHRSSHTGASAEAVSQCDRMTTLCSLRLSEHNRRIHAVETAAFDGVLIWKIDDYRQRKEDAKKGKTVSIYSQPFFSENYGYKMCARVFLNGDGKGKDGYLSLFFVLMRGKFDNVLPWPFCRKIKFMVLAQTTGNDIVDSISPSASSAKSFEKPKTKMNLDIGCPFLASHEKLEAPGSPYIQKDTIFIKIMVDEQPGVHEHSRHDVCQTVAGEGRVPAIHR